MPVGKKRVRRSIVYFEKTALVAVGNSGGGVRSRKGKRIIKRIRSGFWMP